MKIEYGNTLHLGNWEIHWSKKSKRFDIRLLELKNLLILSEVGRADNVTGVRNAGSFKSYEECEDKIKELNNISRTTPDETKNHISISYQSSTAREEKFEGWDNVQKKNNNTSFMGAMIAFYWIHWREYIHGGNSYFEVIDLSPYAPNHHKIGEQSGYLEGSSPLASHVFEFTDERMKFCVGFDTKLNQLSTTLDEYLDSPTIDKLLGVIDHKQLPEYLK